MARKSRSNVVSVTSDIVKNTVYKTAVYARLSAEKDESIARGTIDNQVNYIKNFISQQSDMEIYDIYVDDDVTGTNYNRPEFQRMMSDIRRKKLNAIVVKDLSRLGRDYLDTGELLEIVFPRLNVRVVSINDKLDTKDGQPDLMIAITNIVNDYYAKDISKKVYAIKQYQKEKGIPQSILPYGYKSGKNADGDRIMIIDDEPAEVIRLIFNLYISGKGKQEIANILNEKGYLSPYCYMYSECAEKLEAKPHLKWTMDNVGKILVNDVYIGIYKTGKTESALFRNQKETKKPKDEWLIFEDHHQPIISKEVFMKAAAIKASKTQANTKKTQDNFFKGKIFCGKCGSAMTLYNDHKKETYYVCVRKKRYGKSECESRYIRKDYVYKTVFEVIKEQMEYLLEEDKIIKALNKTSTTIKKKNELKALQGREMKYLKDVYALKSSLYGDYADGILTEQEYLTLNAEYSQQAKDIQEKIDDLSNSLLIIEESPLDSKNISSLIKQYRGKRKLSEEMVDKFISKVIVYDNRQIEVQLFFDNIMRETLEKKEKREVLLNG